MADKYIDLIEVQFPGTPREKTNERMIKAATVVDVCERKTHRHIIRTGKYNYINVLNTYAELKEQLNG